MSIETMPAKRTESRTVVSTRYAADVARIEALSLSRGTKRRMLAARYAEYDLAWAAAR